VARVDRLLLRGIGIETMHSAWPFILSSVVFCRRGCDEGVTRVRSEVRFRGKPENICSLRDLPVLDPTETYASLDCCCANRL
jgi:hypothetical protein